ncbi:unnamed protein product [Sympodiomycopsis kandeliae]
MSGGSLPTSNRRPSSGQGSVPPQGATGTGSNGDDPSLHASAPSRRAPHTLPGISSTASSLRAARAQGSSSSANKSRLGQAGWGPDDDDNGFEDGPGDTQRQIDELKGGIVMPGMGARGVSASKVGAAGQRPTLSPQASASGGAPSSAASTGAAGSQQPTTGQTSAKNRIPTTLKSALKKQAPLLRRATAGPTSGSSGTGSGGGSGASAPNAANSGASGAQNSRGAATASAASRFKGTPPRAIRYSLPVRAEKPVRTTKTSGKHVVLPSESQLAPLPGEEEEDDDDDDEDDDEDDSEDDSEESDTDEADHADDEDPNAATPQDEEAAEKARKERREAAQKASQERKEQRAAEKAVKKQSIAEQGGNKGQRMTPPAVPSYHGLRGPAHSRAPPRVPKATGPVFHTFERLAPSARVHTPLPRLTSYTLGTDLHIPTLNGFLRREHGVRPRLYDECAYTVYFKPLLPGFGRANIRSSPEPRSGSPGAESRRERELEEREERGYVGSYFAAAKEENEESIDPQGYIQGGEGSGGAEDGEQQRNEQSHHSHHHHSHHRRDTEDDEEEGGRRRYGGETTEAETETEGEGEREKEELVSSPEGRNRDGLPLPSLGERDTSELLSSSLSEGDGAGEGDTMTTPRALQPRETGIVEVDELEPISSPLSGPSSGMLTPVTGPDAVPGAAVSADVAGAQDMLLNQLEDEATERGFAPSRHAHEEVQTRGEERERSSSPTRFADGEGFAQASGHDDEGGSSLQDQSGQHVTSHDSTVSSNSRRRRRRPRKSRKLSGPNQASHNHDTSLNMLTSRSILEALQVAELVVLPYGVVVFYNFSASEERDIMDDIMSSGCVRGILTADDIETEAFHFCYDPTVPAPRIFNDFFTFRGPNHLLKISLAHAIAQSTKLSVFEESMQRTLELTSHIPKELASSGELQLKRREALRLTGRLFKLRVDVNLTSNVLDTPELFWSEATLQALYDAIRDYLEIDQRVENLNDRLKVANDLLEIIHGHVAEEAMSKITVVIIALIVVACIVACGEITARLVLHARGQEEKLLRYAAGRGGQFVFNSVPQGVAQPQLFLGSG